MPELISDFGFPIVMCLGVALFTKSIVTQIVDQFISTNTKLLETNELLVRSIVPKVDNMDEKLDNLILEIKKGGN